MASLNKTRILKIKDDSVLLMPLARLGGYDPKTFCSEDVHLKHDRLVLTLAHAYNDLKDLFLWWEINKELAPGRPKKGVDKKFGQACGIENHVFRLLCGWLVEVLSLLEENQKEVQNNLFSECVSNLVKEQQDAWRSLCGIAISETGELDNDLRKYIVKIRSNGTFHYNQTKALGNGFTSHFSQKSLSPSWHFPPWAKT